MKKLIILFCFLTLFIFGSILTADVNFKCFEHIHESNHYVVYSSISHRFNYYISVAAETLFEKLSRAFDLKDEDFEVSNRVWKESIIYKNPILIFPDNLKFEEYANRFLNFSPDDNTMGFNSILQTPINGIMNIAFFVPNIQTDPIEEIYNYSPLFQALTEQFINNYLGSDIPKWLKDGIFAAVGNYKKEIVFSLFFHIEKFNVISYERTFWSDIVLFNKYWKASGLSLESLIDGGFDTSHSLYKSYTSILANYLLFNPPVWNKVKSKNIVNKIKNILFTSESISSEEIKNILIEEFGSLEAIEDDMFHFYSENSYNLKIHWFWTTYNSAYKNKMYYRAKIYTTDKMASEYEPSSHTNEMLNLIDTNKTTNYTIEADENNPLLKGEAFIIDTTSSLPAKKIYIHLSNFALNDSEIDLGNDNLFYKARVVTSIDGKNWRNWGYINTEMPIIYFTEKEFIFFRYWGIVTDIEMKTPITINEMWIH